MWNGFCESAMLTNFHSLMPDPPPPSPAQKRFKKWRLNPNDSKHQTGQYACNRTPAFMTHGNGRIKKRFKGENIFAIVWYCSSITCLSSFCAFCFFVYSVSKNKKKNERRDRDPEREKETVGGQSNRKRERRWKEREKMKREREKARRENGGGGGG